MGAVEGDRVMTPKDIVKELIEILDCYEGKKSLISNQGQALDGYAALENFLDLARKAKEIE